MFFAGTIAEGLRWFLNRTTLGPWPLDVHVPATVQAHDSRKQIRVGWLMCFHENAVTISLPNLDGCLWSDDSVRSTEDSQRVHFSSQAHWD